jgi:anti-repressor protein
MNNLQVPGNGKTLDSREVAEMVGKDHAHLMRDIKGYIGIIDPNPILDSADYFIESTYIDSQNQARPCYRITKQGCEMIANKLTGKKGVLFTAAYVAKFNQMEQQQALPQLPDFTNPAIAARAWAEQYEQREQVEKQLTEAKPKVEFYDDVAGSKDAIEIGEAAKVLNKGIGRNKLFQFLRDSKVLMQNNQPYQQYVDRGYFRVIEQKFTKPNGDTNINIKTLVYQRGLDFIRKLLTDKMLNPAS